MDTEVLIVGAGPTGLMLANQLGRRGVRTLIIDRHAGPSLQTRALGVQARTLEIYAKLGLVDRALELGKDGSGANIWAEGRHMAHVPLGEAGRDITRYPFILVLGQDDNERIMGDKLRDWGLAVQWNTELVALEQHADGVTATLKQPDGTSRRVTAAWVAGCDGARSAVRELNKIEYPGAPYQHVFFVADTEATGSMVADQVNAYLWRSGFHLFFPMRGKDHWRLVGILPQGLRDRDDVTFDDVIPSLRSEAGSGLSFAACTWFSTYRISHRSAARFRDRRCFLLGDAAHIHSPVGAQGMNTGLQDAYNLGWKLALVAARKADAALLDSYENERLPVAQRLLDTTDRAFRLVVSDSPVAGLLQNQGTGEDRRRGDAGGGDPESRFRHHFADRHSLSRKSAVGIGGSVAVRRAAGGRSLPLAQGEARADRRRRRPVRSARRHALQSAGDRPAAPPADALDAGDLLRLHTIPVHPDNDAPLARAGIAVPSYYLLRPDGHVGLCGVRLDVATIRRYLAERLNMMEVGRT